MSLQVATVIITAWVIFSTFQQPSAPSRKANHKAAETSHTDSSAKKSHTPSPVMAPSSDPDADAQDVKSNGNESIQILAPTPEKPIDPVERTISIVGVICTVILAAVGVKGILVALDTIREMRNQGEQMGRQVQAALLQVQAMQGQITEMSIQSGILQESVSVARDVAGAAKDSADAARDSASAARDNIELYIGKERARLGIELKPLELTPAMDQYYTVNFTVNIYGPTDAFVTESGVVASMVPDQFIDYPELGEAIMLPINALPMTIPANNEPLECWAIITSTSDTLISEVKEKRLFVAIRGFIKYKDVFDRQRETAFRYVWKYSFADFGNWVKSGKPEENRET